MYLSRAIPRKKKTSEHTEPWVLTIASRCVINHLAIRPIHLEHHIHFDLQSPLNPGCNPADHPTSTASSVNPATASGPTALKAKQ